MEDNGVPVQQPIDVLKVAKMANELLELMENTPAGVIKDGDTILADIMEQTNFDESGTTQELVTIWKQTTDKEMFHRLFMLFTGFYFEDYLELAIKETTRP